MEAKQLTGKHMKSDLLNQIGGKPSRDLKGAMDKLKTADKFKKSGASADLNPQPLPPGPPPDKVGKKDFKSGVLNQIGGVKSGVDTTGKSVLQLNPQPLPPDKVDKKCIKKKKKKNGKVGVAVKSTAAAAGQGGQEVHQHRRAGTD